jgi:hypothetical protein
MARKDEYAPLHQHEVEADSERLCDADTASSTDIPYPYASRRTARIAPWLYAVVILLVICNGITLGLLFHRGDREYGMYNEIAPAAPDEYAIPDEIPYQYRPFWWNTEYSSANQTLQDELWESIRWAHGVIAIDTAQAKAKHWPDTMSLPSDANKGVYVLEGYLEVHCLWILRRQFKKAWEGTDAFANEFASDASMKAHIAHCFDFLLQVRTQFLGGGG